MAEEKKAAKKAEILDELQSIRGLLDEELVVEGQANTTQEAVSTGDPAITEEIVPTLQEIVALETEEFDPELISQIYRNSLDDEDTIEAPEPESIVPLENLPQDLTSDSDVIAGVINPESTTQSSPLPSGPNDPLPGQQSLFGEDRDGKADKKDIAAPSQRSRSVPSSSSTEEENPFLPKHIRDRLQGNKPHLGMQSFVPSKAELKSLRSTQHQAIIDEVIADYLPKIEIALRQRLETMLKAEEAATEDPIEP